MSAEGPSRSPEFLLPLDEIGRPAWQARRDLLRDRHPSRWKRVCSALAFFGVWCLTCVLLRDVMEGDGPWWHRAMALFGAAAVAATVAEIVPLLATISDRLLYIAIVIEGLHDERRRPDGG
jgi:hypothetical protein